MAILRNGCIACIALALELSCGSNRVQVQDDLAAGETTEFVLFDAADGQGISETVQPQDLVLDAADAEEILSDDGADAPDICQPDCEGKECGDDGCGGSCGQCPQDQECLPEGICAFVDYPYCEGKECGPDGYGGTCGECEEGFECTPAGKCEAPCIGEGESLGLEEEDVSCCEGLTALPHFKTKPGDDCEDMECCFSCDPTEDSVCGACGDGVCGPGENACNCEDCPCYPLLDSDGDGVVDEGDNCPDHYNPNQANCDKDMMGDACDPDDDNDLTEDQYDCAPCDATIFPGAVEKCNGKDDDCDGLLDEGFFSDLGDWCAPPFDPDACDPVLGGHWECSEDGQGLVCVPNVFPGGVEICDGVDNNCDGEVDEGYPDTDSDGLANCVDLDDDNDGDKDETDCVPLDSDIHHGAAEECNGVDDDCDGETDGEIADASCDDGETCVNAVCLPCQAQCSDEELEPVEWCAVTPFYTCGKTFASFCELKCHVGPDNCPSMSECSVSMLPGACKCGPCPECPDVYEPLCGTDGYTYWNECDLLVCLADPEVGIACKGECPEPTVCAECPQDCLPVCGILFGLHKYFRNSCFLECAGAQSADESVCCPDCPPG